MILSPAKTSHVHDVYKEVSIPIQSTNKNYTIQLVVRAFIDGLAFGSSTKNNFELPEESTTFNLANNPTVKALLLPNYTTSHEGYYPTVALHLIRII